ncbi:MAG: hypothetical protein HKN52_10810 [Eudoraea sp.]|nr:hypothetical protein [Eudoraea sp.]NNE03643.1 hypothetical protein [Eudoraea sp.]
MRILIIICAFFCITSEAISQDCSTFFPMNEGTKFQITVYDKKDEVSGIMDYVVKEVGGNTATMFYEMHDEKGKMLNSSEYSMNCSDDGVTIDFSSMMSPEILGQYEDMEVEMTGTDLLYPNNLSTGQSLPDADVFMTVKMPPINLKMNMNFFNRKVEGKESVTTPAGTFDCYLITYDSEAKMGFKMTNTNKLWLSEGHGMVLQETYNKKGKLIGKSVLTAFNK